MRSDGLGEWIDVIDHRSQLLGSDEVEHGAKFLWAAHRRALNAHLAKEELGHIQPLLRIAAGGAEENIAPAIIQGIEHVMQTITAGAIDNQIDAARGSTQPFAPIGCAVIKTGSGPELDGLRDLLSATAGDKNFGAVATRPR